MKAEWYRFVAGPWTEEINVRNFIQLNYVPYEGDEGFLSAPTDRTQKLWSQVSELMKEEHQKGVLDADTKVVSSITSHGAGYIAQELEQIVGLQTDKPLKRALMPYGGIRMAKHALEAYGYKIDPQTEEVFTKYRKTHNEGVFDVYTQAMRNARSSAIITGLPDAYGRGRIVGDYRRVALYGTDFLIGQKEKDYHALDNRDMDETVIRLREEVAEQVRALKELTKMAATYDCDISRPASNAKEAIQWLYFAYLAAVKEQNGAAMSLGRATNFIDAYIERDIKAGVLNEAQAQELIDHFVMKLRMVRFSRTPEYNELFSGDPTWVTESLGGIGEDGRPLVTKTSYRMLHTLYNLGPAPEPNLTILWSEKLPENFKKYCSKVSIEKSSIQYESDEGMREHFGDDYCLACCVSAMKVGKQMQFFGARANLAKALLYAINGGRDELSGEQITDKFNPIEGDELDYDEVMAKFDVLLDWLAKTYVNTLNVIHYMHDKYCYERIEMALHDTEVIRTCATGVAGLSVVADSLSAIKYAKVKPVRNEKGLVVDYKVEGEFPHFGNNDPRVDDLASSLVNKFMDKLRKQKTYRNSIPTLSILTITSNVVYGKKTGNTPCGRKHGEPFAPGANPLHGRDKKGAVASMASVAKLPYEDAMDGISYTFSIVPKALGKTDDEQVDNLCGLLDGYFIDGGHHINVNVFDRETLVHAMEHPELYPQLTVRVSGYAVNFTKLNHEQQLDVINRTFHQSL